MDKYELLRDLIQFNTSFDAQNKSIMEYIDKYLCELGFKTHYVIDDDTHKLCLVATVGENIDLGFVCHTDTTALGVQWDHYDPMTLTMDGDKFAGLGICDMKGGMAAVLAAVGNIDWRDVKKGLKLYFTFDEENHYSGIKTLIAKEKAFPQNLIIPAPTNLYPVISTKGLLKLSVLVTGKEAHSSDPTKGINAIENCVNLLGQLYQFNANLKADKNNIYELPYTTFNLGKINGGSSLNRVPGECSIYLEYRTIKAAHHQQIIEKINELATKYNSYVTIIDDIKPITTFGEKFIVELEKLTGNKRSSIAVVTDGSFLGDYNVVLLGPGPITSGTKDEYISKFSYDTLIRMYTKYIKQCCY